MRALLFNPKIFNYILLTLYLCAAGRWALEKKWGDVLYWICAFGLLSAVTFFYKR